MSEEVSGLSIPACTALFIEDTPSVEKHPSFRVLIRTAYLPQLWAAKHGKNSHRILAFRYKG